MTEKNTKINKPKEIIKSIKILYWKKCLCKELDRIEENFNEKRIDMILEKLNKLNPIEMPDAKQGWEDFVKNYMPLVDEDMIE
ncbi:MAG: hypothetical protein IJ583_02190 [Firmicutes bacterium]|nr:hypothetical protein [Bacillota bacterium]